MCQHDFAAPKQAGDPRMEVHHLDGEGEAQSKNHDLDNLMTLCSRCHRQFHQIFLVKEDGEWKVQGKMLQMLGIKSISTTV
jgi:5-methylcytosine-specific restriction endonuclease McrA